MKDGYSFRIFNCNRQLIPDCWHSYRESTFANIELSRLGADHVNCVCCVLHVKTQRFKLT